MGIHTRQRLCAQSGQAAVETALTLPLTLFLLLGVLQLSMMLQARIMAQYAVYQAVRAGSLNKGDCRKMQQAALVALLPTITRVSTPTDLGDAFGARCNPCSAVGAGKVSIHYDPNRDRSARLGATNGSEDNGSGYDQQIFEIVRERPTVGSVSARPNGEDTDFDEPRSSADTVRLEVRMLYWYRLRIPFVDWVMTKMFLAYFGLKPYTAENPLMETQKANWAGEGAQVDTGTWPGGDPGTNMRKWAGNHQYLFPIKVTAAMRMMTPAKAKYFKKAACPL